MFARVWFRCDPASALPALVLCVKNANMLAIATGSVGHGCLIPDGNEEQLEEGVARRKEGKDERLLRLGRCD